MGESEGGPWAYVFDQYIINEIIKGMFMFVILFIDVTVMLLEKMTIPVFQ